MSSILKNGLSQPSAPTPRPPTQLPLRYASAAAAAVAQPSPPSTKDAPAPPTPHAPSTITPSTSTQSHPAPLTPTAPSISSSSIPTTTSADPTSSPSLTHPSTSPMLSTTSISGKGIDGSDFSNSPALSDADPGFGSGPAATSSPQRPRKGQYASQNPEHRAHWHSSASTSASPPSAPHEAIVSPPSPLHSCGTPECARAIRHHHSSPAHRKARSFLSRTAPHDAQTARRAHHSRCPRKYSRSRPRLRRNTHPASRSRKRQRRAQTRCTSRSRNRADRRA